MRIPEIDLEELEKQKKDNFQQRLEFIDQYVKWLKKTESQRPLPKTIE